jgi:hypothetical protein
VPDQSNYWFPAKRYGWGWGLPLVWQGWAVFVSFLVLVAVGALYVLPTRGALIFGGYTAVICLLLVAVCWIKGEPPRWRWGK